MEHRKLSMYLKMAGAIAGMGGGLVFLYGVPMLAKNCRQAAPELAFLYWPGLIFAWCLGLLYTLALVHYIRICHRIGQNHSFCPENARDLFRIAALFFGAAIISLLGIGAWLVPAWQLGPGWLALLLVCMASAAVGVLAWALGKLLQRAAALQEENDLTV